MAQVCSPKCALEYAKNKRVKTQRKEAKAAILEMNRKTLKWQHEQTQKSFNKMRVLQEKLWFKERGRDPECISCGKTNMDWCCGHLKTRGSHPELRYDEQNTFLQCNRYCNMGLSGNIHGNKTTRGYIAGLSFRFGSNKAQDILSYLEKDHVKKWTCEELEEMRARFNAEIRRLEKLV